MMKQSRFFDAEFARMTRSALDAVQAWLCRIAGHHMSVGGLRVHFLEAGVTAVPDKSVIRSLIFTAYRRARRCLPSGSLGPVDVVVQVQPAMTLPEIGIGGYSPSANLAFLFVDPLHPKLRASLPRQLGALLAHELMHCARWHGPGYGASLGEALVSEGLALHFEAQFRGETPWYAQSLNDLALAQAEVEARAHWHRTDYDRMAWFSPFGAAGPYRGYSLGYLLVGRRLARAGRSCVDLYNAPASEF